VIPLHPHVIANAIHECPRCARTLEARGFLVPGARCLAKLVCPGCSRRFLGDLPAGHGLQYPMLLDEETGEVTDRSSVPWFADALRRAFASRGERPFKLEVEERAPARRAVLVNCLDSVYGHSVLKLLNAARHIRSGIATIVLVPASLRWMVPASVAQVWTLDAPSAAEEWNDALAAEIARRVATFDECFLSVAFSHPHPDDFAIQDFTGVPPFARESWDARLAEAPTVTFIPREDRPWARQLTGIARAIRFVEGAAEEQARNLAVFAESLKKLVPRHDLALAGAARPGSAPAGVADLRVERPDAAAERRLCERYARSHVVLGVHGSNMLLPSAHAGAAVELLPRERLGNAIQSLLPRARDAREALFHYRLLPLETGPEDVARVVASVLFDRGYHVLNTDREWTRPGEPFDPRRWVEARRRIPRPD
jgi:hypothetical protein